MNQSIKHFPISKRDYLIINTTTVTKTIIRDGKFSYTGADNIKFKRGRYDYDIVDCIDKYDRLFEPYDNMVDNYNRDIGFAERQCILNLQFY